jgi:hypothetical protein
LSLPRLLSYFYAAAAGCSATLHHATGAFWAGGQGVAIAKINNADNEIAQVDRPAGSRWISSNFMSDAPYVWTGGVVAPSASL